MRLNAADEVQRLRVPKQAAIALHEDQSLPVDQQLHRSALSDVVYPICLR